VAPYCQRYYCDAAFAYILRDCVQGREPPTTFQVAKKLYRKGLITREVYEAQREAKAKLSRTVPLLEHTAVFSFSEMQAQII
jgi:hypothetical protein